MAENKEEKTNDKAKVMSKSVAQPYKVRTRRPVKGSGGRRFHQKKTERRKKDNDPYDSEIISIRRVTNVKKGGKNMGLSVLVVVGDKKGKVGIGSGKAADVRSAQEKAVRRAKKSLVQVQLKGNTIPHEVKMKDGAALLMMKPAPVGTGVIAGTTVRAIVELAGIQDIVTKIIGTSNHISNAHCTLRALKSLRTNRS